MDCKVSTPPPPTERKFVVPSGPIYPLIHFLIQTKPVFDIMPSVVTNYIINKYFKEVKNYQNVNILILS